MQQLLSAILLSAALLLSGTAVKDADPDASAKTGSYFIRVPEAATQYNAEGAPTSVKNIATVAESTGLHSSYSKSTKVLAQLKPGDTLSIKRTATFSSIQWVYATAGDYNVSGWVPVSNLNMPDIVEDADLDSHEISEDYIPAYAKMGIVTASQLNIRTAPGTGFDRIGSYCSGNRVGILETNNGWGRTAKGWISLSHVYLDGQVGQNTLVGNVSADLLNIRSGPGAEYTICGSYNAGDRLLILEQVFSGGSYWGCTHQGWVSMNYILPDFIPGTAAPIYGYGMVEDAVVYIYPTCGTEYPPVEQVYAGSVVPVFQAVSINDVLWGRVSTGWINMSGVDMRAIFELGFVPNVPPEPIEPPTEPTTESTTEPATEAVTETAAAEIK